MKRLLTSGFFLFLLLSQTTFHYFYSDKNAKDSREPAANDMYAAPQAASSVDEIETIYHSAIQNELILKERADANSTILINNRNESFNKLVHMKPANGDEFASWKKRLSNSHVAPMEAVQIRTARMHNLTNAQLLMVMTMNTFKTSITEEQRKKYGAMLNHLRLLSLHSGTDNGLFAYPYSSRALLSAIPTNMIIPQAAEVSNAVAATPALAEAAAQIPAVDPNTVTPKTANVTRTAVGPSPVVTTIPAAAAVSPIQLEDEDDADDSVSAGPMAVTPSAAARSIEAAPAAAAAASEADGEDGDEG